MERDGSKEPVPYTGILSGPSLPRTVLPLGLFPKPLPQGDSLWLAPSAICMRQAPRKRSGPVPTSWGYYSTHVLILQVGLQVGGGRGLRGRRGGLMVADAVVPPARPPTFLGTGGLAVPPAGAAPPAPRWGNGGGVVCHLARLEPLPSQPLEVGRGTEGLRMRRRLVHLSHPPTFLGTGDVPLHPAWGAEEAQPNPLPSLPPNTETFEQLWV